MNHNQEVVGVILAGGLSRRMNGINKAFCRLGDKTLIERVIESLRQQTSEIIIIANDDINEFTKFGWPVVSDSITGYVGPLGGILAAYQFVNGMQANKKAIISTAVDSPFLPLDFITRLAKTADDYSQIVIARSNDRLHPVAALWPVSLANDLKRAITTDNIRKIMFWVKRHNWASAEFPSEPPDPFFNINTPQDLIMAEKMLAEL